MRTEVAHTHLGSKGRLRERARGVRQHDLSAMGRRGDSCSAMHIDADVARPPAFPRRCGCPSARGPLHSRARRGRPGPVGRPRRRAPQAGFDSIEHGLMLRPDQAERMATLGIALTPTLISTPAWLPGFLQALEVPDEEVRRTASAVERHAATVRGAWEAGVTILAGTDAGVVAHGLVHREVSCSAMQGSPSSTRWPQHRGARESSSASRHRRGRPADLVAFDRTRWKTPPSWPVRA